MTSVVVEDEAREQLLAIADWWAANRSDAPDLVVDEFARCVMLLENMPDIGTRFHRATVPGVRRLFMSRTRHHIYYLHDEVHAIVYILAVWGSPKGRLPPLRAPR